ncbi:MAG: hypothetical protein Q4G33_10440 [bacterium]|nr:hypothetical protein [bacterium]
MKKVISALAGMTVAASMLAGFAATANAATETKTLSYQKDGQTLKEYTYSQNSNDSYTLDEISKEALSSAKAGDKFTITCTFEANGTAKYRAGIKMWDYQFYVNSAGKTSKNNSFTSSGACHLNGNFINGETADTATVTYEYTLADGGAPTAVVASLTDSKNTKVEYSSYSITGEKSLESIVLNTQDRDSNNKNNYDSDYMTLKHFSAILTTTSEDPVPVITPAAKYNSYTNDSELAEPDAIGFVASFTPEKTITSLDWYLKKSDTEFKKFTEGNITELSGNVQAQIGLIIYDLGNVSADDISAGYSYN